jgi:hypothetical protein
LPLSGVMPIGCVLSTRVSSVRWLAVGILMVAATWCLLLLEGPSMAHPPNKLVVCPPDLDLEAWCCARGWRAALLPAWWGSLAAANFWSSIAGDARQHRLSCLCFFRPNGGPPKPHDGGSSSSRHDAIAEDLLLRSSIPRQRRPKWFVPGVGGAGSGVELGLWLRWRRTRLPFSDLFQCPLCKSVGPCCNALSSQGLSANCNPTAEI